MFILCVRSKGENGCEYVSALLRQCTRFGKKVVSKTLAIPSGLPEWLLAIIERAVEQGKDAASIARLVEVSKGGLRLRCAESFGAAFVVREVAGNSTPSRRPPP